MCSHESREVTTTSQFTVRDTNLGLCVYNIAHPLPCDDLSPPAQEVLHQINKKKKKKSENLPQQPRCILHRHRRALRDRGGVSIRGTSLGGWHVRGVAYPWGVDFGPYLVDSQQGGDIYGGGKAQVLSLVKHCLLQYYIAPFWKATKWWWVGKPPFFPPARWPVKRLIWVTMPSSLLWTSVCIEEEEEGPPPLGAPHQYSIHRPLA